MLCDIESVVHLDAEVPDCAFDLRVAEKQLYSSEITCLLVDQGRLGSAERMGAEPRWVKASERQPFFNATCVLPRREMGLTGTASGEQVLIGLSAAPAEVVVDGSSRDLR